MKKQIQKKQKNKSQITKKMKFFEIINKHPESISILMENGMHCAICHMSQSETIEQGALAHGLNPDELVKKINKKIEKKK